MALNVRKISNDVYERVGSYLCNFGETQYQVPKSEYERLSSLYSQELGREISPIEVRDATRKFKHTTGVPTARGANFRVQLIDGQLITRELSQRYQATLERRNREGSGNGSQQEHSGDTTPQETQTFNIPPHLRPFEREINKQVKLQTYNLRKELMESKKEIKDLKELVKDLSSTCEAEAERFKRLVITHDIKMAEMRHMMKIVEAVDEYTAFKRSTEKRKTDVIM